MVALFIASCCCSVLLHLVARAVARRCWPDWEREVSMENPRITHVVLVQIAAGSGSDGLVLIMMMLTGVLLWTPDSTATQIAGSPVVWALWVLHLSCLWLSSRVVKLTPSQLQSVGLCWQLLSVMCVVFPRGHASSFGLWLLPASALLLDYTNSVRLSLASTGIAVWCHISACIPPAAQPSEHSADHQLHSLVQLLISDCMAFFAAVSVASALDFWMQRSTITLCEAGPVVLV